MKLIRGLAIACCAVLAASAARAQETINHASLGGRVLDPQGAVVPGARVYATQVDTDVTTETTTDESGRFRFAYLKVGPYEVGVHADGFAASARHLRLTLGSAFDVSF